MAIRVGFDLMSAASVRDAIDAHGQSYLHRVFSERELADSTETAGPDPRRLAERFAAKEATLKALGVGDEAVSWRDMEVRRGPLGQFTVRLSGRAESLARRAGITQLSLSLTHERDCAAAVVTAETRSSADTRSVNEQIRRALTIHARLPVDVGTLADDADLYQAGMTSHASVNVMLALEDAFDLEFPDRMLKRSVFESVAAIAAAVTELRTEFRA